MAPPLQQTFDRALALVPADRIWLVVGKQHEAITLEQLSDLKPDRLLLEPAGRDTAAAIAYASRHLPVDALMLILPADHLIPDVDDFCADVRNACGYVQESGGPCTFGIEPDRPETGYGYIQAAAEPVLTGIYPVEGFVEKPDRTRAEEYVRNPSYYWNSGIFLWSVSRIQQLLEKHLPDLWGALLAGASYEELPKISIDYGVMQKTDGIVMVPASFRWDDVGSWNALLRILPADSDGNLVWGEHTSLETSNCILYGESLKMVTAGIRDLVIVQRGSHILICHKDYSDRLKELLAKLSP